MLDLVACGSGLQLVDETRTAPYAALLAEADRLPHRDVLLAVPREEASPWPVFLRDIPSPDPAARTRPVLVLLNGAFSDGATWRFTVGPLARSFDLVVIDLPGTGKSTDADADAQPEETFTSTWAGGLVLSALAAWDRAQSVSRRFVLVGHSIGGAVVLRMLGAPQLRHGAADVDTVGAVLIAAPHVGTPAWHPVLVELTHLTSAEVELGDALGILRHEVERSIATSVVDPHRDALAGEATRFVSALTDPDRRRASQLLLRRIRPVDASDTPIWPAVRALVDDHRRVAVPVLLVWGRDDDILPLTVAQALADEIPDADLVVIDRARHSVHQERPEATADAIRAFAGALDRAP